MTLCSRHGAFLFGDMAGDDVRLNDVGRMLYSLWEGIPVAYQPADIDVFVVMPNHLHGIIVLPDAADVALAEGDRGSQTHVTQSPRAGKGAISAAAIVGRVKSLALIRYWEILRAAGRSSARVKLWHHDYYEHVIRSEEELARIREYITNNPLQWSLDRENPNHTGTNPDEDWLYGEEK